MFFCSNIASLTKLKITSITKICLAPICRYLIRPDPLSQVPSQGSNRKSSSGLSDSHRFDTQDSTHLWETVQDICSVNTLPEREGEKKIKLAREIPETVRHKGMQPDGTDGPSYLFWVISDVPHMHGPFLIMGMFDLCTFLFSKWELRTQKCI